MPCQASCVKSCMLCKPHQGWGQEGPRLTRHCAQDNLFDYWQLCAGLVFSLWLVLRDAERQAQHAALFRLACQPEVLVSVSYT